VNAPLESAVIGCDGSIPSKILLLLVSYQTTPIAEGGKSTPVTVTPVPTGALDGNTPSAGLITEKVV
jgi:hypothetical protein